MNIMDNANVNELLKEIEQLKREITMLKSDVDVEVSVIVAVNDNLSGMRDCFDTLLMQTMRKMEIICMYVGNSEKTMSLLRQYALMDARFVLYTTDERNTNRVFADGVRFARGKYVTFFSQSCWYASDNELKTLYLTAQEQNAVVCGGYMNTFGVVDDAELPEDGVFNYADHQTQEYLSCYLIEKAYALEKISAVPDVCFYYNDSFVVTLLNEAPSVYKIGRAVCVRRLANESTMDCYHRAENSELAGEAVLNVVSDYLNAAAYLIAYAAEKEMKTVYTRAYMSLFTVWNEAVGTVFSSKNTELVKTVKTINDAINTEWLTEAGIAAFENMYHVVLFETMRGEETDIMLPEEEPELEEDTEIFEDEAAAADNIDDVEDGE